jgi:hypothetical protein
MLAILLELSLIVAGFVIKASETSSNWVIYGLFALIGFLVALLIVKLTLTNAAKLRASLDEENKLQADYRERSEGKTVTPKVQAELDNDIAETRKGRWTIYLLIGVGALASIICETFVMHLLFQQLKPDLLGDVLSVFLSALVSSTVISGELHKKRDTDIIRSSLSQDSLLELAAKANTYDAFNRKMINATSTHVEQVLDQAVLGAYAQSLVYRSIEESTGTQNFAQQVESIRARQLQIARFQDDQEQRLLAEIRGKKDPQTDPIKPIQLHSLDEIETRFQGHTVGVNEGIEPLNLYPTEEPVEPFQGIKIEGENGDRYASDYASQVEELYRENPAVTPTQIAKNLGCSYGTAKKWLERVKPANPNNAS